MVTRRKIRRRNKRKAERQKIQEFCIRLFDHLSEGWMDGAFKIEPNAQSYEARYHWDWGEPVISEPPKGKGRILGIITD